MAVVFAESFDPSIPEYWEEAQRITTLIGLAPNPFTTCTRFLVNDASNSDGKVTRVTRYLFSTLARSATVKSALYHAALTYRPEKTAMYSHISWASFLEIFTPIELAHILGIFFSFKRIKRGCPEDSFNLISQVLQTQVDIGGLVGDAIPSIGLGRGITTAAISPLSSAMFLGIDEATYRKYSRALKLEGRTFDPVAEIKLWRCTHIHIASYIIQLLGFGIEEAMAHAQALMLLSGPPDQAPEEAYRVRITHTWIESLIKSGKPPEMVHRGEYYPKIQALERLVKLVNEARKSPPNHHWLTKTAEDISPATTPQLFHPESEDSDLANVRSEISEDILREIDDEKLKGLD